MTTVTSPNTRFRHEHQVFNWAASSWDIAKLISDLDSGALRPKQDSLERGFIEAYSQSMLALTRNKPATEQGHSVFMHVNVSAALALPQDALTEPVIILETAKNKGTLKLGPSGTNHVLADGNHRITKAFFEDVPALPVYILSAAQSRRYRIK